MSKSKSGAISEEREGGGEERFGRRRGYRAEAGGKVESHLVVTLVVLVSPQREPNNGGSDPFVPPAAPTPPRLTSVPCCVCLWKCL